MDDSSTAKMIALYISVSSNPSPIPNAAMINENSPRHVIAVLTIVTSLLNGLNG